MSTLIGVHIFHRVKQGRALHLRPEAKLEELTTYMTPGATLHKLDDESPQGLLLQVDEQLAKGEFQSV